MDLLDCVAQQIRELRMGYNSGQGLSQVELAKALDVAPNTISRWETGTYKPGIDDLERLSIFFGVAILFFFPKDPTSKWDTPLNDLLRTAENLPKEDLIELQKYAEFRKIRSIHSNGKNPKRDGKQSQLQ